MVVHPDSYESFDDMYYNARKGVEISGSATLYEDGQTVFSKRCGITMKGWTSLYNQSKKNMAVYFRDRYGDGKLKGIDLFGSGITKFSALALRSGQDYPYAVIRNELFTELCKEFSDSVIVQDSMWCALYIDSYYWGLYSLKKNMNEYYYASVAGVSKDSVTEVLGPVAEGTEIYALLQYCINNDMSSESSYRHVKRRLDTDSLIDWIIIEGYSGNTYTERNVSFFVSTEKDGKWRAALFDMDRSFTGINAVFSNVIGGYWNFDPVVTGAIKSLCKNPEFRADLLRRYSELSSTVLSNEHVLAKIDEMCSEIDAELKISHEHWGISYCTWIQNVDKLREFITGNDYSSFTLFKLCKLLDVSEEEREIYFY